MNSSFIGVCVLLALPPAYGMDIADGSVGTHPCPTIAHATAPGGAKTYSDAYPTLRERMAIDAAFTGGFQSGLAERGGALVSKLERRADELDALYSFASMVGADGLLAPVVVEASDVMRVTPEQVRTAGHVYRIERAARFVSVAPTWRDYLTTGLSPVRAEKSPFGSAAPVGSEIPAACEAARAGWREGRAQADAILVANFNRLNRDYVGMIRYAILRQQGMISIPVVSEAVQSVTGDTRQVMINDRFRRLMAPAQLQPDGDRWQPVIIGHAPEPAGAAVEAVPLPAVPLPP